MASSPSFITPSPTRSRILAVVHDERAEVAGIGQRAAHHLRVGDRARAVGEGDGAGLASAGRSRSSPGPARPLVRAAAGMHAHDGGVAGAAHEEVDHAPDRRSAGSVSGMQTTVVTPPAAAARLADASVSRCSAPGSPTKARMSTRPGASTLPAAVDDPRAVRARAATAPAPRSRMTPSVDEQAARRPRGRWRDRPGGR